MEKERSLKADKYAWLAYVYFFFNSLGLPYGLLYMHLLTPYWYLRLLIKQKKEILHRFLLLLLPFDLIHYLYGVDWDSFIKSNLLLLSTYIFVYVFYLFLHSYGHIEKLFKKILITNFIFTLIAIGIYFTPYREWMWYLNKFTAYVDTMYRLAMFTYEASYYSLLFSPIAFYYLLKVFLKQNEMSVVVILLFVLLPLGLSFSLGVLGAMVFSFLGMYLIHWRKIFYKKSFVNVWLTSISAVLAGVIFLLLFFPENPLFIRVVNIFTGMDSSANGRTVDAFTMAFRVAGERSIWFGSGLGQIKVLAYDIVQKYYHHWGNVQLVRIPNAMAETLGIFGIFGVMIRLLAEVYFFFRTKVLSNYYRTVLFIFIFIYQFTGSYITNIAEYVVWAIAFSNAFKQFDLKTKIKHDAIITQS
jgi:hypothetical protein